MKESADYFWFGTGVHYALEDFHGYNIYGHPAKAFLAYYEACRSVGTAPSTAAELLPIGMGMMVYYADHWLKSRDPLKTLIVDGEPQCELNGSVDLGYHDSQGRKVLYRFTIDRMIEDEFGRLWIGEYKTAKQFSRYHLDTDDQITSYCVPLSTEILTMNGWKRYNQLTIGEAVLGFNTTTQELEWTFLEAVHLPGTFPTVSVANKSFQFECTVDHKWVQVNENNKWPASKGCGEVELKPIKAGRQHHYAVLSAPYCGGSSDITPDEAAVIAWLLTDGTYTYDASICQSRSKHASQVQELLSRFPSACSRVVYKADCNCNVWYIRVPFFKALWAKAGLDKDLNGWESFVLGLSSQALSSFCEAAFMAEGSTGSRGQMTFYQNVGPKTDMFRLAFFLTGKFPTAGRLSGTNADGFANKGLCRAFSLGTPHKWLTTITSTPTGREVDVWCPQTSLRTWVMRQGDLIAVTGNCWTASKIYPDREIAGVQYMQFKKDLPQMPKILASGKVSTDARMGTTHSLYKQRLLDMYGDIQKAPAENIRFLNALVHDEDDEGDKFVIRQQIERNAHQIAAQEAKVRMELEEMLNPDLPLYPNPTRDCSWQCPLQAACIAMDDGSDWERILEAYVGPVNSRDTTEDLRWQNHLPNPQELLLPQEQLELSRILLSSPLPRSQEETPEEQFLREFRDLSL